jgi:hypothetical protein
MNRDRNSTDTDESEPSRVQLIVRIFRLCTRREHLVRTGGIALVVGTWLTLFNHGPALIAGHLSGALMGKIILNYLTPFTVSNLGLISHTS